MDSATITKGGEIHFPTWAKLVGSVTAACLPLAIGGGLWVATNIFDMSVRMARIEAQLSVVTEDRYRKTQADDAHNALNAKIEANAANIRELQRLHGRQNGWSPAD